MELQPHHSGFDTFNGEVQEVLGFREQGRTLDKEYVEILDILSRKRVRTVFQPIFDLQTGEVYAYECLTRINGDSRFSGPEPLFEAAARCSLTEELETLCRSRAIRTARQMGIKTRLTLNVSPDLFQGKNNTGNGSLHKDKALFALRDRIVLELTEKCMVQDGECLKKTLNDFRNEGFQIAIDDLGAGYAGLRMLAELTPGMVKIDRFLISHIAKSTKKRMLVESLVSFCHKINAQVVAEGIETREDLAVILSMNVDLAQGFYLGRPAASPTKCHPSAKAQILHRRETSLAVRMDESRIGSLSQLATPVEADKLTEDVIHLFESDTGLTSVPIVKNRLPVGIVEKTRLFFKLGQQFGYSVYSHRPIKMVMEPALVFESETPLEKVSEKVLSRDEKTFHDSIVVVRHGLYAGIVKIRALFERISQQRLLLAMQANPLTGLPGNNLVKEEILQRLSQNQLFAVLYFDLDHFKPFNDQFGFEQGDQVIRFLATILKDCAHEWDLRAFVGHIGGDDFVVVCRAQNIENLCRKILKRFREGVKAFHDPLTVARGYYESVDRSGRSREFALLSLSIAVVTTLNRSFASYGQLVSAASEVKKKAKSISGNSFYLDQRQT
jgi:diguanylate cyclase (GGDEF)-like protein